MLRHTLHAAICFRCTGFVLLAVGVLGGCASPPPRTGAPSTYHRHYADALTTTDMPPAPTVRQHGFSWTLNEPLDAAWGHCIAVIAQYPAVLALSEQGQERMAVVLAWRPHQENPENRYRRAVFGEFFESWLVLVASPGSDASKTTISVAKLEPSGHVDKESEECMGLLNSVKLHAGERRAWFRVANETAATRGATRTAENVRLEHVSDSDRELEDRLGGWISKRMSISLVELSCPEATASLECIMDRLKRAAGATQQPTRIHVVASPSIAAFALPNGDVYVSAGVLNTLNTPDEVAAVMAHELVHLLHHHSLQKLKSAASGRSTADTLRFVGTAAAILVGAIGGAAGPAGQLAAGTGSRLAQGGAEASAQYLEGGLVTDYAAEVELEADAKSYELLSAAGYSAEGEFAMMNSFAKIDAQPRESLVVNTLLTMKPGIAERIKALREVQMQLSERPKK